MIEATKQTSSPQISSKTNFTLFPINHLQINSERQYRLIFAILKQPMAISELIQIVGANNIPDVVRRLRAKGWEIATIEQKVKTRDGLIVSIGLYRLDTPLAKVKEAMRAWRSKKPLDHD